MKIYEVFLTKVSIDLGKKVNKSSKKHGNLSYFYSYHGYDKKRYTQCIILWIQGFSGVLNSFKAAVQAFHCYVFVEIIRVKFKYGILNVLVAKTLFFERYFKIWGGNLKLMVVMQIYWITRPVRYLWVKLS